MIDYYLMAANEQAMVDAIAELPNGASVDVIGEWYERTGGTDEEPEFTQVPGWHFNVRSPAEIQWPDGIVQQSPVSPWRVWG